MDNRTLLRRRAGTLGTNGRPYLIYTGVRWPPPDGRGSLPAVPFQL